MLKPLLFAAVAGVLFYQIFTIGLANNGDFPRIAGRLSLCPADGWDRHRFTDFVPVYAAKAECFWDSGIPTSAMPAARLARWIESGAAFHIRTLGVLYALMLLAIFGWLLRASSLYVLAAVLFLDVGYIAYCNSFFLEAMSLVGLLGVFAAAVRKNAVVFTVAGLLLITSKTHHAWLAAPLAVYAVYAFRPRVAMLGAAAVFVVSALWMSVALPADYKALGLWDSVFVDVLPYDASALAAFHVGNEYAVYSGRNAYQFPDQATADRWTREFYTRSGYRSLVRYYASHPGAAVQRMWRSAAQLYKIRPVYLALYERSGSSKAARPLIFSWWTDWKSAAYLHVPWLVVASYVFGSALLWKSRHRSVLVLLAAMALIEFPLACFADNIDDYRHNFLLHAVCDIWLCFAFGHAIARLSWKSV